eukprot:2547107-Prymnesium_polylepis.1
MGDSWAADLATSLKDELQKRALTVDMKNLGSRGQQACWLAYGLRNGSHYGWASRIAEDIRSADYVWLSVGINDLRRMPPDEYAKFVRRYYHSTSKQQLSPVDVARTKAYKEPITCLQRLALRVLALNPEAHIVQMGYDLTCRVEHGLPMEPFSTTFPQNLTRAACPSCLPCQIKDELRNQASCKNHALMSLQDALEQLVRPQVLRYKRRGTGTYSVFNLQGTLQAAGGVPGASTGHPVVSEPSPNSFYYVDCLHVTLDGRKRLAAAMAAAMV